MERLCKWINEQGSLYLADGKRIGPGETFQALPSSIPAGFRDTVRQLDAGDVVPIPSLALPELNRLAPVEEEETTEEVTGADLLFIVEERAGGGWFDVVNVSTGKAVTERALRRTAAEELAEDLNDVNNTG